MRNETSTRRTASRAVALDPVSAGTPAAVWVKVLGVVGFALAAAVAAHVRVYVPGTPVPMTLQTLVVLLAGVSLGPWLGSGSMLFYLLLGATGYHVFATEALGVKSLVGPTAGYLLGFVLAQPVLGLLTRSNGRGGTTGGQARPWRATLWLLLALLAGHGIIFVCGLGWLRLAFFTDWTQVLTAGFWPFVPGLVFKTLAAFGGGALALRYVRPRMRA